MKAKEEVLLRIEGDYADTLARSPRMQEESTRELLVSGIGRRLGTELSLRIQTSPRAFVIGLVRRCTELQLARGLELLVKELGFLEPLAPEVPQLWCLSDEWHAASVYADDHWPELETALRSIALTDGDGERSDVAALRRLAATATGGRSQELPPHCSTLWQVFLHLAGSNTLPGSLPPCMVFLDCVAREISDSALNTTLRMWNRHQAERLDLTDQLDAAQRRGGEQRVAAHSSVHLIIQIEHDPGGDDRLLVSHWRQWDPDFWRPQRGTDKEITSTNVEAEVDNIIAGMESMLGARADVARTGEIWIEFVLPVDMLNLPVHLWSKKPLLDLPKPLVIDHPVVVRSLERLHEPRLRLAWHKRWANLSTTQVRPYWSQPSGDDYFVRLAAELGYDERIMSLVLSGPPEPGNSTALREVIVALQAGIPAIIWHQLDCSSSEFREAVHSMVGDGALIHLPQRVTMMRRDALRQSAVTPGNLGMEVALLWDDPDRLPELQPPRGIG